MNYGRLQFLQCACRIREAGGSVGEAAGKIRMLREAETRSGIEGGAVAVDTFPGANVPSSGTLADVAGSVGDSKIFPCTV
ncbi:MAG: hypothetical protein ACLSHO_09590 [Dysosmobacter sp.]